MRFLLLHHFLLLFWFFCLLHSCFFFLFMQDPEKTTPARKAWYQKAMEVALLCKTIASKPNEIPTTKWKPTNENSNNNKHNNYSSKVRKCSILSVTTSLTRVCLCVPISSYAPVVLQPDVSSTRTTSIYLRTTKSPHQTSSSRSLIGATGISLLEGRRVFRGKSLTDDVLMRRFVIEEEAMWQVRRRNQMEVIRRRSGIIRSRTQLGPSPLSRMVLAEDV